MFADSPFAQVPTAAHGVGSQPTQTNFNQQPSAMPMNTGSTYGMGPSPHVTPNPSRATSAQHGSFERNTHSDVFGRRLPNSRMNSPRPSRVRSATADIEEDERDDRRSEKSD